VKNKKRGGYMRAQTSSYVVSVKLKLTESVENRLEKTFRIASSAYNEALSFGLRRLEDLKQNSRYQELLELRRNNNHQVKEYDKELLKIRKMYSLTEFGLSALLGQQRKKPNSPYKQLNSGELQVIASQAYKTLEKVLFYRIKPSSTRFRSKYDLNVSYRNRVNTTGTRIIQSDRNGFAYRLYIHKSTTFVDIPIKAFNNHQQMSLLRSEKIKYVQIIRKTIRGKHVYILQIVCQGSPVTKVKRGEGTMGIDPGISTVAYVSKKSLALVDLVPKNVNRKEKLMRYLDRAIERSRRVNNPNCYNSNGTIKKDSKLKHLSNRQVRLQVRRTKSYRSLSEERKKIQGQLVNHLVSQASLIKIEDLNIKGLQRRSKEIRINPKTNRPFSKKRFGKSVFRAAPSSFRQLLQTRARQLGVDVEIIKPQNLKPSQYNHLTKTFEKKTLSTRLYDLSDKWTSVQRDLYSAFLIGHIENGSYQQEQIAQDFPDFYKQMKKFLQKARKTNRLDWYLN
jgi:hypothetical protein